MLQKIKQFFVKNSQKIKRFALALCLSLSVTMGAALSPLDIVHATGVISDGDAARFCEWLLATYDVIYVPSSASSASDMWSSIPTTSGIGASSASTSALQMRLMLGRIAYEYDRLCTLYGVDSVLIDWSDSTVGLYGVWSAGSMSLTWSDYADEYTMLRSAVSICCKQLYDLKKFYADLTLDDLTDYARWPLLCVYQQYSTSSSVASTKALVMVYLGYLAVSKGTPQGLPVIPDSSIVSSDIESYELLDDVSAASTYLYTAVSTAPDPSSAGTNAIVPFVRGGFSSSSAVTAQIVHSSQATDAVLTMVSGSPGRTSLTLSSQLGGDYAPVTYRSILYASGSLTYSSTVSGLSSGGVIYLSESGLPSNASAIYAAPSTRIQARYVMTSGGIYGAVSSTYTRISYSATGAPYLGDWTGDLIVGDSGIWDTGGVISSVPVEGVYTLDTTALDLKINQAIAGLDISSDVSTILGVDISTGYTPPDDGGGGGDDRPPTDYGEITGAIDGVSDQLADLIHGGDTSAIDGASSDLDDAAADLDIAESEAFSALDNWDPDDLLDPSAVSGLPAISRVTSMISDVVDALGDYNVVWTIPLTLGLVAFLIGL